MLGIQYYLCRYFNRPYLIRQLLTKTTRRRSGWHDGCYWGVPVFSVKFVWGARYLSSIPNRSAWEDWSGPTIEHASCIVTPLPTLKLPIQLAQCGIFQPQANFLSSIFYHDPIIILTTPTTRTINRIGISVSVKHQHHPLYLLITPSSLGSLFPFLRLLISSISLTLFAPRAPIQPLLTNTAPLDVLLPAPRHA